MPADDRPASPRPRPTYGLPGPARPGADAAHRPSHGLPGPGAPTSDPPTGSTRAAVPGAGVWTPVPTVAPGHAPAGSPAAAGRGRRRPGLLPLLLGLGSLLLGGAVLVVGLLIGAGSVTGAIADGPRPLGGSSVSFEAQADEMYLVYVPAGAATTCTAEGSETGATQVVPTSGTAPIGPGGEPFDQQLGIWVHQPTTVTISCTGEDAAYLGPVDPMRMVVPVLVGIGVGALLGGLGLVLTIIGIVRLARGPRR